MKPVALFLQKNTRRVKAGILLICVSSLVILSFDFDFQEAVAAFNSAACCYMDL